MKKDKIGRFEGMYQDFVNYDFKPDKIKYRGFEIVPKNYMNNQFTHENIILPKRSTKYSAGYDFYINVPEFTILPKTTKIYWTDICVYMNKNEVLKLYIRSSIAIKHDIILKNQVGIVDCDYYANEKNYGNIGIALYNTSNYMYTFRYGDKVAQGIFEKYYTIDDDIAEDIRIGGVGSTNE